MGDPAVSPLQPFTESGRLVGARLCFFKTGSAELLSGHKDWITSHFIPKMRQHPNAWVDFIGYASRLGSADANQSLSQRRIAAVEKFIKDNYPEIRVNMRIPDGAADAESFKVDAANDEGYWRAVLLRWYGVPLKIETPVYPPEEILVPKVRKYFAPKGCWCIVGVDTFGIPIKAGVSGGTAAVTLLNDKGEKYVMKGIGAGGGLGIDVAPVEWAEKSGKIIKVLVNTLKEVGLKAGDLQNVSDKVKSLNLTGPSETNGGVFKRVSWEANLTIDEIKNAGFFTIGSGEGQFVIGGAELGFIFFGVPPVDPLSSTFRLAVMGEPWGYYASVGLGTLKGALGISATVYKTTSVEKEKS